MTEFTEMELMDLLTCVAETIRVEEAKAADQHLLQRFSTSAALREHVAELNELSAKIRRLIKERAWPA